MPPPAGSTWFNILRGFLEVLGGVVLGVALGFFLRYFPSKDQVKFPHYAPCAHYTGLHQRNLTLRSFLLEMCDDNIRVFYHVCVLQKAVVLKRSFLLLGLSVFAVFGSNVAGFPGSGGLCTLVLAFLAGTGWEKNKV